MEKTVDRFVVDMKSQFSNFTPFIATRVEGGILKGAFETLRQKLVDPKNKDSKASLELPFGTITAEIRTKNDVDNINVGIDFSKDFIRALNGEIESVWQDTYDDLFIKNFMDYVSYGFFDPDSEEHKKLVEKVTKCLKMKEPERDFFPNAWTNSIVNMVKDKQRDGKIFNLDLDAVWDAGTMTFEFNENSITPTFNASKTAKQYLKNGDTVEITSDEDVDL